MIGLEDCESLFTRVETEKAVTEEYSARRFLSIQPSPGQGDLGNIYRVPGMQQPAGELSKARSHMVPLLRLLESGKLSLGGLRPRQGMQSEEVQGIGRTYGFASDFPCPVS